MFVIAACVGGRSGRRVIGDDKADFRDVGKAFFGPPGHRSPPDWNAHTIEQAQKRPRRGAFSYFGSKGSQLKIQSQIEPSMSCLLLQVRQESMLTMFFCKLLINLVAQGKPIPL